MTRLTRHIKNRMITSAIKTAGIYSDFDAIKGRRLSLAESIRVDSLGGEVGIKEIEKVAKSLKLKFKNKLLEKVCGFNMPEFSSDYELYGINLGGMRVNLQYNGDYSEYETPYSKRTRKSPSPKASTVNYDAKHKFTKEFLSIENENESLKGKKEGLTVQLAATLDQFTTIKKLLDAWPEAKELLPTDLSEAKPQLPVVQVKDLNCLIGLPK